MSAVLFSCTSKDSNWPPLSDFKFIKDRYATEVDVKNGSAVFVIKVEEQYKGIPIDIQIPQYAIHINQDTQKQSKCIVIQAEVFGDLKVFGAVIIDNDEYMAGLDFEFRLLGDKP
ncbi:MAG: hypothetical protein GY756_05160 [bacterium]|nr:hypothetical protein [bacterium]